MYVGYSEGHLCQILLQETRSSKIYIQRHAYVNWSFVSRINTTFIVISEFASLRRGTVQKVIASFPLFENWIEGNFFCSSCKDFDLTGWKKRRGRATTQIILTRMYIWEHVFMLSLCWHLSLGQKFDLIQSKSRSNLKYKNKTQVEILKV